MSPTSPVEFPGAQLSVDMRVWSLLLGETRRRTLTRMFGVPAEEQTLLVTLALIAAGGAVLGSLVPHLPARPSGASAAIGGSLVNTSFRGLAGAPSQAMPLAGALIAFAIAGQAFRPAVEGAVRDVRATSHRARAAFSARYKR